MPGIFISYSHPDEEYAKRLFDALQERGLDPWMDKESLLPGQDWQQEIKAAISKAEILIVLLSANSVNRRGYFQKEIKLSLDVLQSIPLGQIFLIPVRLENCIIPDPLRSIHWVDMFPNWDQGLNSILKAINYQIETEIKAVDKREEAKNTEDCPFENEHSAHSVIYCWKEGNAWNVLRLSHDGKRSRTKHKSRGEADSKIATWKFFYIQGPRSEDKVGTVSVFMRQPTEDVIEYGWSEES